MTDPIIGELGPGQRFAEVKVVDLEPLLVDEQTAGKLLGCSSRMVFSLVEQGKLPCVKLGARKLYRVETLKAFALTAELTGGEVSP